MWDKRKNKWEDKRMNICTLIIIFFILGITPEAYFAPIYTGTKHGVVGFTRCWSVSIKWIVVESGKGEKR